MGAIVTVGAWLAVGILAAYLWGRRKGWWRE